MRLPVHIASVLGLVRRHDGGVCGFNCFLMRWYWCRLLHFCMESRSRRFAVLKFAVIVVNFREFALVVNMRMGICGIFLAGLLVILGVLVLCRSSVR